LPRCRTSAAAAPIQGFARRLRAPRRPRNLYRSRNSHSAALHLARRKNRR